MQFDLEVRGCSRVCAKTERTLQHGDVYFSVVSEQDQQLVRLDYCAEAWEGEPAECVGWWRSRVPESDQTAPQLAPTDVLLNLFEALEKKPSELTFRYLLGLLLLRRKVLRREDSHCESSGREVLSLSCPRRNETYELWVVEPTADEAERIQQRMIELLYGDGESADAASRGSLAA